MDYENLTEITVKSQKELDMIPKDFKGHIYIEFGTHYNPAVVKNKYYRSVEAWENSSVEAWGNSQIVDCLDKGKIKISGNARIVYNPKNVHDFMRFYGIKHSKKKAIFYKAVKKSDDGVYHSDYDNDFTYTIGQKKCVADIDTNVNNDCGVGIHISPLNWALNFGCGWNNLAIIEVETNIDDIICPLNTTGKVRTSAVTVIREVPLEECGLYGKILAQRKRGETNEHNT